MAHGDIMKVIIVGGGAAGVIHALYLKGLNKNIDIVILEKNERILKKLMKTGNGRCNISNLDMSSKFYNHHEFIENLYDNCKSNKIIEYFRSIGLLLKTDFSTRLYPYSESAKTVIDTLRYELDKNDISIYCNEEVIEIKKVSKFQVKTTTKTYESDYVVIASGSKAQENTDLYSILKSLNHKITALKPGLVPLKIKEDLRSLQGIKVKCSAKVIDNNNILHYEEGELLFKDNGISGILVLNMSRYVKKNSVISLDLFYDYPKIEDYIRSFVKEKALGDILASLLPKMLANYIIRVCNDDFALVLDTIRNFKLNIVGDYGFSLGQIVLGGVDINNINNDFSSKIINGLYIIGEVLDIDGASGGYNLHFAWTSGIVSAISIFEKNLNLFT